MRRFRLTVFTMGITWASLMVLAAPPAQGGGEDFPFFCTMAGEMEGEAFKIMSDATSVSGYQIILYHRGRSYAAMPGWIADSDDRRHYVVYGRQQLPFLVDRQFLALIAKASQADSGADIQRTVRGADATFELSPAQCGLPQQP